MNHVTNEATFEIVADVERLGVIVEAASQRPSVAIDIESNGFHRYPERICLLQLAWPGSIFLIDPLTILDTSSIGKLLENPLVEKVMHSADYDVRSLDREWGFRIHNLFDTSIAAAFVGSERLGLAAILSEYLDVTVSKHKELQRSDWTKRPLSFEAQQYAADDVLYLDNVRNKLIEHLKCLGRIRWVKEECERQTKVRFQPRDLDWAFASMKGSRALDPQGLGVLRSLFWFREKEATRMDRPPFKVIPDSVLVSIAASPFSDLASINGLGRYRNPPGSVALRNSIGDGIDSGPIERPISSIKVPHMSSSDRIKISERLKRIKGWRSDLGRCLKLDPGLLWKSTSLERIARSPADIDREFENPEVRVWQRDEFGDVLRSFVDSLE